VKRFHFAKAGLVCLAVVVALGSLGVAYGYTSGTLRTGDMMAMACVTGPLTWVVSNDDGAPQNRGGYTPIDPGDDGGGTNHDIWGDRSSDDPSEPQTVGVECARYDKDVARTKACMSCDHNKITVRVENAYPCYYPTVFFGLRCPDSNPGTITSIVIENPYPDALTITTSGIYEGQIIPKCGEVTGAVHVHVEQPAAQNTCYTFEVSITIDCTTCGKCDTAYAYSEEYATCFLDCGFSNWGWTNGPLGPGYYEFELWAGAAGCDISKGTLVGWLSVDYDGSTAIVTYNLYEGNYMTATHLYVGSDRLPKNKNGKETVAPGQYPYAHAPLDDVTTDSYTVTGLSGNIYIVAHADVCWRVNGGSSWNCGSWGGSWNCGSWGGSWNCGSWGSLWNWGSCGNSWNWGSCRWW
jgi:hypothetical protein